MLTRIMTFLALSGAIGVMVLGSVVGAGILVGSLVTAGMFLTLGVIPGFWVLAETKAGAIILGLLTAIIAHKIMGGGTVTGVVAVGWAFVAKTICLAMARAHKMMEAQAEPQGADHATYVLQKNQEWRRTH